jgi:hypothetical protein
MEWSPTHGMTQNLGLLNSLPTQSMSEFGPRASFLLHTLGESCELSNGIRNFQPYHGRPFLNASPNRSASFRDAQSPGSLYRQISSTAGTPLTPDSIHIGQLRQDDDATQLMDSFVDIFQEWS